MVWFRFVTGIVTQIKGIDRTSHERLGTHWPAGEIDHGGCDRGQNRHQQQPQSEVGSHGPASIPTQRRPKNPDGQRQQKSVHQHQSDAPEFGVRDPAEQQRHGKHRQHRQQTIKGAHRSRRQFAEHDVITFQIG